MVPAVLISNSKARPPERLHLGVKGSTALAGITAPGAISRYLVSRRLNPKVAVTASTGLAVARSEEHTSELQSLMRISYAVFCLKKKKKKNKTKQQQERIKHNTITNISTISQHKIKRQRE